VSGVRPALHVRAPSGQRAAVQGGRHAEPCLERASELALILVARSQNYLLHLLAPITQLSRRPLHAVRQDVLVGGLPEVPPEQAAEVQIGEVGPSRKPFNVVPPRAGPAGRTHRAPRALR